MACFIKTCFITDLLQQVIVSSIISFFMSFYINSSDDKVIKSINLTLRILGIFELSNIYVLNGFFYY